jgi:Domain of unknown function (DUF397)
MIRKGGDVMSGLVLPAGATWRKSSHSGKNGNCVELACLPGERVAVRNSRDPQGGSLIYETSRMAAFMAGVKSGDLR